MHTNIVSKYRTATDTSYAALIDVTAPLVLDLPMVSVVRPKNLVSSTKHGTPPSQ